MHSSVASIRLLAERERRRRIKQLEAGQRISQLIEQARQGAWRPLFEFQWPAVQLDKFQEDILDALFDPTIWGCFVKGNTGCGKSAVGGMGIALFFTIWPDSKTVVTSTTFDHAKSILFGETVTWLKRMQCRPAEFVGTHRIGDEAQHYVEVVNPATDEAFSGRHGEHVLFCFDEASAVADSRFKLAKTQATKFLAFSNPRSMFGFFRRAFPTDHPDVNQTCLTPHGRCRFQTIDGQQIRNVREKRLEKPLAPVGGIQIGEHFFRHGEHIPAEEFRLVRPIIPGQLCYDSFLALKADTDPRWVQVFCHGRFPEEDPERQVILRNWLKGPNEVWQRLHRLDKRAQQTGRLAMRQRLRKLFPIEAFGLDVAASEGGDETILCAGGHRGIIALHHCRECDTMAIVGWVIRSARSEYGIDLTDGQHPVAVDMDGLGKGVGDRLAEQNVRVIEIHGNDTARDPKLYLNARAERYAELGLRLDPKGPHAGAVFVLPTDEMLSQELCSIEKYYAGSEALRFGVIPKRQAAGSNYSGPNIRDKIGRSPDRADAVSYCLQAIQRGDASLEAWLAAGAF